MQVFVFFVEVERVAAGIGAIALLLALIWCVPFFVAGIWAVEGWDKVCEIFNVIFNGTFEGVFVGYFQLALCGTIDLMFGIPFLIIKSLIAG